MALVLKDRVQETTTTTGTGTITLAGAVSGFQSFSAIGDGNTTYYAIIGTTEWEIGIGTYTSSGTTLSRDTVLSSSNSGSLVNFSAGSKTVFVTYPTGRVVIGDGTSIQVANNATLPVANGGTGANTLTSNNVILGNGTSAVQFVAPGTSSNVLTSNGTTWVSQAAGGSSNYTILSSVSMVGSGAVDFTGIPSTAKQIIISIHNCSTTAAGIPIIRVGDSGFVASALYNSVQVSVPQGTPGGLANTTGFLLNNSGVAGNVVSGTATFTKLNNWIYTYQGMWGTIGGTQTNIRTMLSSGAIDMANIFTGGQPITIVRAALTTADTFDSGVMSVAYIT
jgi:hypothetical protein